ncbi:hypothetical protein GCM10023185_38510 [Hymenobacter saemangeumensis]|uniref:Secretion system C-terminal sorting domain-containing protein n=1 Tax=Hymenobacter saemangeumensis TaxID=1084522 RepID=A0ABP8IQN6_9BACT
MRVFTKLFLSASLALSSLLGSAATITVEVGDNFYQGVQSGSSTITMNVNDVLEFVNVGGGSHPTASSLWATFQMNPGSANRVFPANSFTPGTFSFRCTAHSGMTGTLVVRMPSATADASFAAMPLNIFPNPSKGGLVTVKLEQHKAGSDYKLRLSNIIGREIRTVALKPEVAENGLQLDLSDLPSGMYFYSLLLNDKVINSKRLVLQN